APRCRPHPPTTSLPGSAAPTSSSTSGHSSPTPLDLAEPSPSCLLAAVKVWCEQRRGRTPARTKELGFSATATAAGPPANLQPASPPPGAALLCWPRYFSGCCCTTCDDVAAVLLVMLLLL
uniref:Uncharacterized protein n=1 Tax=Triticum urartu TaxID=4572 RepID=A0A8R7PG65_TRIUA